MFGKCVAKGSSHYIPQRYIVAVMVFFAFVHCLIFRICLSIAITKMTEKKKMKWAVDLDSVVNTNEWSNDTDASFANLTHRYSQKSIFNWDQATQGYILGSYYWGYLVTNIPGGILSERYGAKHVVNGGFSVCIISTLITPCLLFYSLGEWKILALLRIICGLGEGLIGPSMSTLLGKWAPPFERARFVSFIGAGADLGIIIGNSGGGAIIKHTGTWSYVFYIFGGSTIVWLILWNFLCYSDPESHPRISEHEKKFLQNELKSIKTEKRKTPWRCILTSVPVWVLLVADVGHRWGIYTVLTDLPKYMKEVLHFHIEESGYFSSLPFLAMWKVSIISGYISDMLLSNGLLTVTITRKLFATISSLIPSIFVILASYCAHNKTPAVIMFTISMGFMGATFSSLKVNSLDLAPNFAGSISGFVSFFGAMTGIAAPSLAGVLTYDSKVSQWRIVFWISFVVMNISNLVFVFFGSGEEQCWNNPKPFATQTKNCGNDDTSDDTLEEKY